MCKLGGLDGRDQSRSRSRTSFVSRLTFENRRDYPSRRDQLLKVSRSRVSIEISTKIKILGHKPCRDFVFWTIENVLHVETNFWKLSRMSIMSRSTFENRRDRESRSRPCRDKSRPPSLERWFPILKKKVLNTGFSYLLWWHIFNSVSPPYPCYYLWWSFKFEIVEIANLKNLTYWLYSTMNNKIRPSRR